MVSIAARMNPRTTQGKRTLYWVSTIAAAVGITAVGAADLARVPSIVQGLQHLGYPVYFASILGVWKLLGSIAIVVPGMPRLKEWAYAGMFFTLTGAVISEAVAGDLSGHIFVPVALLVAVMLSWMLQPARIRGRIVLKTQRDAARQAGDHTVPSELSTQQEILQ